MSNSEMEEPLVGHDPEPATARWRENSTESYQKRRFSFLTQALAVTLLIPLLVFFVLRLQWHDAFEAPVAGLSEPSTSATVLAPRRDLKLLLHPEDHVSRDPEVRHFSWNITQKMIAPDGVLKEVFLINNQFPGPTIEARSGDTLEIEVINLARDGVSLHWHGLHMRGANHMDGPVGITQCAIEPGVSFTYRIPIGDQAGTFWYHGHSEIQRGDGLYGGLVIHEPGTSESVSYQYDEELLFLVGDWYHWPSRKVLATFMDRTSTGDEPCPDSLLLNGLGYFECSMATPGAPVNCSEIEKPWLMMDKQHRYRVRLVNVGSLTGLSFAIPDSGIEVIQVDGGCPVISHLANSVGVLYPGERVDFILGWPESALDTDTEITIDLDREYFIRPNYALTSIQSFLLSAQSATHKPADITSQAVRFDLQKANGPSLATPVPDAETFLMIYTSIEILNNLGQVPYGFVNRTTWKPSSLPLVSLEREAWDRHQLVPWTGSQPVWVELTINNIDATGHPFHLHGFDFYVVGTHEGNGGWDYYNPFNSKPPRGGPFNLQNPLRKDTVYVPHWGYVVVRFLADNEGIWKLHCHILWHHGSGMSMAIQVLGDGQKGLSGTEVGISAESMCKSVHEA